MAETFKSRGPRERQTPTQTRVRSWQAHDKSSSGRLGSNRDNGPDVFTRAPNRDERARRDAERRQATEDREEAKPEAAQRETTEVRQNETAAADSKPAARKRSTKTKSDT